MDTTAELFSTENALFINSITGTCVILAVLIVGGLMFEYGYLRPRHRMIESAKSKSFFMHTENHFLGIGRWWG